MKTIRLKGGGMSHCSAERGGGYPKLFGYPYGYNIDVLNAYHSNVI